MVGLVFVDGQVCWLGSDESRGDNTLELTGQWVVLANRQGVQFAFPSCVVERIITNDPPGTESLDAH